MELIGHANVGDWRGFATFRGLTEIFLRQATHGTANSKGAVPFCLLLLAPLPRYNQNRRTQGE
jgi:hypothetical protein